MTILVTGSAGYIGSHVVLEFIEAGHGVIVLDNLSTGFRWAVPKNVPLIVGDVGDEMLVRRLCRSHGIEGIIHMAGSVVVPDSMSDPLGYYLNNTVKSRALIASAVTAGVERFLFSSTAAVYGNPAINPVSEEAILSPQSLYGSSKMMTETMLADVARAQPFRYVALRYFNVAGADPRGRTGQATRGATHMIKVACETALDKRASMSVFGTDYATRDGSCIRDFIHVTDLARAHVAALDYLGRSGTSQVLNCGYSRGFSVLDVIAAVRRVSGRDFAVELADRRPGDIAEIVADASKIRRLLSWSPEHANLDGIVADALAWEEQLSGRGGASGVANVELASKTAAQ